MSNDTRNDEQMDGTVSKDRFRFIKTEVVSGGTQSAEVDPVADPMTAVLGIAAWIGLFVVLGITSPWALVFVLGIAVSIMLHELGHFWTARKSGMKATQFFLGFGPRVWSMHRNGVEYGLRAIPLGGFVKIIGMTNVDEVPEEDEPLTYRQASYARRMWVITAGSVMHAIIAVVLITIVYATVGNFAETGQVKILNVSADTPAAAAGLREGDIVTAINDTTVTNGDDFHTLLGDTKPGTEVTLDIIRDGSALTLRAVLGQNPNVDEGVVKGFLGVVSSSLEREPMPLSTAIVQGPKDLVNGVGQATVAIAKVINPINVWGHLTGSNKDVTTKPGTIVGAVSMSDDVGKYDGWVGMLVFLANINLVLGVFNMFPLMPLDGGHAAIATYERLRSRRGRRYYADVNKLMPVAAVCIMLIAFMFLTGLYLDTVKG